MCMYSGDLFAAILVLALLGFLIYLPIRFFLLIGEVKALEKAVKDLAARVTSTAPTARMVSIQSIFILRPDSKTSLRKMPRLPAAPR